MYCNKSIRLSKTKMNQNVYKQNLKGPVFLLFHIIISPEIGQNFFMVLVGWCTGNEALKTASLPVRISGFSTHKNPGKNSSDLYNTMEFPSSRISVIFVILLAASLYSTLEYCSIIDYNYV